MTYSLNTLLSTASDIAEHAHDQGLPPVLITLNPNNIPSVIRAAIEGAIAHPTPSQWAMIVDAQEAARLLTKSESFGPNDYVQQNTYLEAANRLLAEAVSWLV